MLSSVGWRALSFHGAAKVTLGLGARACLAEIKNQFLVNYLRTDPGVSTAS